MYIVIEGQDATGKTTQAELLAEHYRQKDMKVITLNEPDGDLPQAHLIRDLVKTKSYQLQPLTHVMLFTAARLELWYKLALPVLQNHGVVISARNWWSTLAYQGYGQGVSRRRIVTITKNVLPVAYINPTHAVILTLNDKERHLRQASRDLQLQQKSSSSPATLSENDTFEAQPDDFQQRVNHAYLKIAQDYHIPTMDAAPSPDKLHQQILQLFAE